VAVGIYVFVTMNNSDKINFKDTYALNLFNKYEKSKEKKEIVDAIQDGVRLSFRVYLIYLFMCNNIVALSCESKHPNKTIMNAS